jgi:hypothetical protein
MFSPVLTGPVATHNFFISLSLRRCDFKSAVGTCVPHCHVVYEVLRNLECHYQDGTSENFRAQSFSED